MKIIVTEDDYIELCSNVFKLINCELENPKDIEAVYPKLVTMYEFFRLLRGEAFVDFRVPTPDFQKELYDMEAKILSRLKALKDTIPDNSAKAKFEFDKLISQDLKL